MEKTAEYWRRKNAYYYGWLDRTFAHNVRPGSRVLHVGCEAGDLLAAVNPAYGVGIDTDERAIESARRRFPQYRFEVQDPHTISLDETFDYILICNSIGVGPTSASRRLRPLPTTICIIIVYYSHLWEGLCGWDALVCGVRRVPELLPPEDIVNFLYLSGYIPSDVEHDDDAHDRFCHRSVIMSCRCCRSSGIQSITWLLPGGFVPGVDPADSERLVRFRAEMKRQYPGGGRICGMDGGRSSLSTAAADGIAAIEEQIALHPSRIRLDMGDGKGKGDGSAGLCCRRRRRWYQDADLAARQEHAGSSTPLSVRRLSTARARVSMENRRCDS